MKVEICLDSLDSVRAAADAGADRIELCSALTEGGLTPTLGTLIQARRIFPGIIVHMIRPRRGDFLYSPDELAAMADDIRQAGDHGADEFVFGCLQADGSVDREACSSLIQACSGHPHIFHRAFDVSQDLPNTLESLIEMGFTRVLTSGGMPDALQGAEAIASLQAQASGRIGILPGGGITPQNAELLVRETKVDQIHLSARSGHDSPMRHRCPEIAMGAATVPGEYETRTADTEQILAVRQLFSD